jgi:voltage-gated potassium channel
MSRSDTRRMMFALSMLIIILLGGGAVLWWLGNSRYSYAETVYFTLITVASVGFSELPHMEANHAMRLVTGMIIIAGVGTMAFFQSTLTALLVEGVVGKTLRRARMQKKIAALNNHLVVAGCGRTGKYIVEELSAIDRPFVVIDRDEEALAQLNEQLDGKMLYVVGDATEDHTLLAAGVERAYGIMAALTDDRDNLFIVISTRALNPKARIVSKVIEVENEPKLLRAGADQTVSPHRIGGFRMVSELVRPKATEFFDRMLRVTKNLRLDEVELPKGSIYEGKTLREVPIRQQTRLLVVALHEPNDRYIYNPQPDHPLGAGTQLIVMGEPDSVEKLRGMLAEQPS